MKSDRKTISLTGRINAIDESSAMLGGRSGDACGSSSVAYSESEPDITMQGWMLKRNRNNNWQERYFVFQSDQILSYYHKPIIQTDKGDKQEKYNDIAAATNTATFKISRIAGCEISDLYVEQRSSSLSASVSNMPLSSSSSSARESLYCINITWTVDADTIVGYSKSTMIQNNNAFSNNPDFDDDASYQLEGVGNSSTPLKGSPHPKFCPEEFSYDIKTDDAKSVTSCASTGRRKLSFLRRRKLQCKSSASDLNTNENIIHSLASSPGGTHRKRIFDNENECDILFPLIGQSKSADETDVHNSTLSITDEQHVLQEQEKLHHEYRFKQRKRRSVKAQRMVDATKVAMAAGAAVGVGVLTAGVGLAAGLVFLGGAAAIGGTAGVAEVGYKRTLKKKDSLTIATTDYALARLWKAKLDACLQQEAIQHSTWAQRFAADGGKTASALIPRDIITLKLPSEDENDAGSNNKTNKILSRNNTNWRPLDWGTLFFGSGGAHNLRIFKEEKICGDDTKIITTAIDDSACTPLRSQLVLNAHPTEAFMCIMSYARIHSHKEAILSPNSGQTASYRLLDKKDDQMDVLHLVCREMYLFPVFTEARDFVLNRYWRYEPDGTYIICFESAEHPDCPPQPGFVRGTMHQVYTIAPLKNNIYNRNGPHMNECMLTAVVQVDPKGWIPTRKISCLSNQTYADAFGVSTLLQTLDIKDAIEIDRFHNVSTAAEKNVFITNDGTDRELCESLTTKRFSSYIGNHPKPLEAERWAEPDPSSFMVRGHNYKEDGVKVIAGTSIGQLFAVDVVRVDKPILTGMSRHPNERIQLALKREKETNEIGEIGDAPPFTFVVNIVIPGTQCFHAVFYYAVNDINKVNGNDGTPSSRLCEKFIFGDSDEFRDETFKLIPRIVEGNFMVRKAVGSTPAIMGTRLKQHYVRTDRFMELILDCGSSQVAESVLKLSLGYAKTLVVDMGFLLEAVEEEHLPESMFGVVRMKYPSFGSDIRKVDTPPPLE